MQISIKAVLFLFFLLGIISQARADIVHLKSGYQMEGVIKRETDEYVELEIGLGAVKFYRGQIEHVEYSSQEQRKMLEESWQEGRLKKEAELKSGQEEKQTGAKKIEAVRQGNHLVVNALLNGKISVKLLIDTGASFVVLSPAIAKGLNVSVEGEKPDLKMTLADGREVTGKLFNLNTVSIGEVKANDVQAAVIKQEGTFSGFDGLLGMSFLKAFKFEINLEKNKLSLKKL